MLAVVVVRVCDAFCWGETLLKKTLFGTAQVQKQNPREEKDNSPQRKLFPVPHARTRTDTSLQMSRTFLYFLAEKYLVLGLLGTTQQTSTAGSNETSLLTGGSVAVDSGSLSDMLMVTTSVGMVDGVHGHTTSLGPSVALDGELMLGARRLEEGLVGTGTTGNNTDHTTGGRVDDLLGTRGKLDTGLAGVLVVTDDSNVVTGRPAERTTVTSLLLNVGNDGTLGHRGEGKDVADVQRGLFAGVDELAGVHALVGNESLGAELVAVRVAEDNLGQGSTTTRVVDDIPNDTASVSVALSIIEGTELGGVLSQPSVGREDGAGALSLVADNSSHCAGVW